MRYSQEIDSLIGLLGRYESKSFCDGYFIVCAHRWHRDVSSYCFVCSSCGKKIDTMDIMMAKSSRDAIELMFPEAISINRMWEEMVQSDVDGEMETITEE